MILLISLLYLILPGVFANMAPPLTRHIPFLIYPIDFKITWRNKPLLGANKTYRGFFFGILSAIIIAHTQQQLYTYTFFQHISLINYATINIWLFGFLIGFGCLFGDLLESFAKRRLNIAPGQRFFPWDQLDALIGGLIFLSPLYWPGWYAVSYLLIIVIILHIIIKHIGYYLGIEQRAW